MYIYDIVSKIHGALISVKIAVRKWAITFAVPETINRVLFASVRMLFF